MALVHTILATDFSGVDISTMDFQQVSNTLVALTVTYSGNLALLGFIFAATAVYRYHYVKKLDSKDHKLYSQENEGQTINDQQLNDLRDTVDSAYNNLEAGDTAIRGIGWD